MTRSVLCVGDVLVDVVARLPSELAPGSDTPAPIAVCGGGSAANTAAWLVAAGVAATFVGRVGDDAFGRLTRDALLTAGIDLELSVDPQRPTGTCIVLVAPDGERTMIPSAGANAALDDAALPEGLCVGRAGVHISAYALFAAGSRRTVGAVLAGAAAHGCAVSVDAASSAPLRAYGAQAFLDWLPHCLLFANVDEAAVLTGTDDPQRAAAQLAARCGEAIVKCGARGAVWSDGQVSVVEQAGAATEVDSTGAGDAFAAGVLAARLRAPGGAHDWLRAGNALAQQAIATLGARPPRRRDQLLRE